jgi:hypothetical protein
MLSAAAAITSVEYVSKRRPRVKQAEALARMRGKTSFALLMDLRTGKTKPIYDEWGAMALENESLDLLVIAPTGAYLPWKSEAEKDLPDTLLGVTKIYIWSSSTSKTKVDKKRRDAFMEYRGPRILLMNMEAISSVEAARDLCVAFGKQRTGLNTAVIDESVTIKNGDSICSKFCVNVLAPLFKYRRTLTGLVSPRSPLDVYYQFKFLDPKILGFDSFTAFRARYAKINRICMLPTHVIQEKFKTCLGSQAKFDHLNDTGLGHLVKYLMPNLNLDGMSRSDMLEIINQAPDSFTRQAMLDAIPQLGGYIPTVPVIESYENIQEINDKIAPYSFRVRLEDTYDMPSSDYSFRDVEMTREQRRIYKDLRDFATAELASEVHVTASQVITQMLRLHQVLLGHTMDENGKIHLIPENRTKSLIQFLDDYDRKAVIWCSYDIDVMKVSAAIKKTFGDGSVARFWGGNLKTREEEEALFKTKKECRFIVATPDAGRFGRTWDVADLCFYYSSRNNLDHRIQSEGRVKADGKTIPIAYVDAICRDTVEDRIIAALRKKLDMALVINGENWRSWLI